MDYHSMLVRVGFDGYKLTPDEASEVFERMWGLTKDEEYLLWLYDSIQRQLIKGERCSVCFKVFDPGCVEGC